MPQNNRQQQGYYQQNQQQYNGYVDKSLPPRQQQYSQNNQEQYYQQNDEYSQSPQDVKKTSYKEPMSLKKKVIIFGSTGLSILIIGIIAVLFIVRAPITENVVASKVVQPGTATDLELVWWKPDTPEQNEEVYSDIIDNFTEKVREQAAVDGKQMRIEIKIVNRKYDEVDYYSNLTEEIAKGVGPDILTIRNDDLPAYKDFMVPITQFKGAVLEQYKSDFVDLAVRDTMANDEVYAVTEYVDNLQMYYNKEILEQNGISEPAKTWGDMDLQSSELSKENYDDSFLISTISFGLGGLLEKQSGKSPNISTHQDILPVLIRQYGGDLYDYKLERSDFSIDDSDAGKSTDPVYQAVKYYMSFSNEYDDKYSWNENMPNDLDVFVEGKLIYMLGYREADSLISSRNPNLEYSIARLPQHNEDSKRTMGRFFMNGLSVKLADETKYQSERYWSEQFLLYLASKEAQNMFWDKTNLPGARRDIIAEQKKGEKTLQIFADGALYAESYYKPDVLKVENIWTDMLEKIKFSSASLESPILEAVKEYEQLVKNGTHTRRSQRD